MIDALLEYVGIAPVIIKRSKDRWGGRTTPFPQLAGFTYNQMLAGLTNEWRRAAFGESMRSISPRLVMQTLGTEWGRQCLCDDFWIKITTRACDRHEKVVVTDCRFPNEAQALRQAGFKIFRVIRPGNRVDLTHASEQSVASLPVDYEILNDSSVDHLHKLTLALTS